MGRQATITSPLGTDLLSPPTRGWIDIKRQDTVKVNMHTMGPVKFFAPLLAALM